jgi:hypothetical protein
LVLLGRDVGECVWHRLSSIRYAVVFMHFAFEISMVMHVYVSAYLLFMHGCGAFIVSKGLWKTTCHGAAPCQ